MIPEQSSGAARRGNRRRAGGRRRPRNHGGLGEPTVGVPAGEERAAAEVLATRAAGAAGPARAAQPGDADPVARRKRRLRTLSTTSPTTSWPGMRSGARREVAVRQVEVRAADPAGQHPDPHLAGPRHGVSRSTDTNRPGAPPCPLTAQPCMVLVLPPTPMHLLLIARCSIHAATAGTPGAHSHAGEHEHVHEHVPPPAPSRVCARTAGRRPCLAAGHLRARRPGLEDGRTGLWSPARVTFGPVFRVSSTSSLESWPRVRPQRDRRSS